MGEEITIASFHMFELTSCPKKKKKLFFNFFLFSLLPQLHTHDRLALATFTESSRVIQPMCAVSQLEPAALKQKIADLHAGGGTALMAVRGKKGNRKRREVKEKKEKRRRR